MGLTRTRSTIIDVASEAGVHPSTVSRVLNAHAGSTIRPTTRQRVLVARTLMGDVGLVLLDEPSAGLDVGGREWLVTGLDALAAESTTPATVLVTHHVEEIPPSFTHALLLRDGAVLAAGPIDQTLTEASLSETFDLRLELSRRNGRWAARSA